MQNMRIESGHIYQHEEYDEVLVLGIHQRYESYDTGRNAGVEDGVYVRYTHRWDGYGAMFGTTLVDPVKEFTKVAGKKLREFTGVR